MVYIPPPQFESPSRPGYEQAYNDILATHRRSPLSSASSVVMLVAPDVDGICASRILADLFRQDDIMYRIIPVAGITELERLRDDFMTDTEIRTIIMINMGAILDLPSQDWFGDFSDEIRVHIIDSNRPRNLSSLFGPDQKIVVWDDGDAEGLQEQKEAWEALAYAPEDDSDEDSEASDEEEADEDLDEDGEEDGSSPSSKRKKVSPTGSRKRQKRDEPQRLSREKREYFSAIVERYYMAGTYYGQAASVTLYILATMLSRADNDLLWLAILGVTFQYTTSRISRAKYEQYHTIFEGEVRRLNKDVIDNGMGFAGRNANAGGVSTGASCARSADDTSIRIVEDLRFTLWRHWNLYDAMMHSGYVASKLGIWREKGRKRLHGLLAKMGFSTVQSQQPYAHMDIALKKDLQGKLESITPEYGMAELSFPSFARCCGYRASPLSAADAVEAVSALLDAGVGVRVDIEVEGARNGGEWFGGTRVWSLGKGKDEERENVPPGGFGMGRRKEGDTDDEEAEGKKEVQSWQQNFWFAFDSLNDITQLRNALRLSMALHRAVIRQGSSLIDKRSIRTMRGHRVVLISQGPDLTLFSHPGTLARLARWLVDAMRERISGSKMAFSAPGGVNAHNADKGKSLPFVVACLDERRGVYTVVGVNAALEFGDVRKNEFGLAFLDAKERCNARTRHGSFDTNVLEIKQDDLNLFLQALCEGGR